MVDFRYIPGPVLEALLEFLEYNHTIFSIPSEPRHLRSDEFFRAEWYLYCGPDYEPPFIRYKHYTRGGTDMLDYQLAGRNWRELYTLVGGRLVELAAQREDHVDVV